jgi:hypothetical protein
MTAGNFVGGIVYRFFEVERIRLEITTWWWENLK